MWNARKIVAIGALTSTLAIAACRPEQDNGSGSAATRESARADTFAAGSATTTSATEERDAFASRELGPQMFAGRRGVCATEVIDTQRVRGDTVREYVWAVCYEARAESGTPRTVTSSVSFPAVLTTVGDDSTFQPLRAEAPRDATYRADFERLFPPSVRTSRHFTDVAYSNRRVADLDRRARERHLKQ